VSSDFDLQRDGFTVLRRVFDESALAPVRALLTSIAQYADENLEDPFTSYYLGHRADQGVLYDLYQRHPEFAVLARNPTILSALATVLGDDFFLYENSVVYKPKGRGNGVPFHQDFISRPDEPVKFIAWMAIDRVTKASGALKVIPASHKHGFLKWHRVKGETHHDRLNPDQIDTSKVHYVELEPGDVLIFNQLVVHGSDEMHTDSLRLVYRVSYQSFDQIYTPRATPLVVHGGLPKALRQRFPRKRNAIPAKPLWRRGLNFVGRVLSRM
jgi:phytanoyl-CoA hydroxylase